MNWTDQAQQMMGTWLEAQKRMLGGWFQHRTEASGGSGPWDLPPWHEQLRKATRDTMETWLSNLGKVQGDAAQRMLNGEDVFHRFVDATLSVFQQIAPGLDAGEDWVTLLKGMTEECRSQLRSGPPPWMRPETAGAFARDLPELLRLYAGEWRDAAGPWTAALREAGGHVGQAMSGDRKASIKMFNLFLDTFESSVGKFAAAPAVGFSREFQEKWMQAAESWVDVRRAEVAFQTELVHTGLKALDALVGELAKKVEKGEKISSYRELFNLWVATAEKTYFEAASTEDFAAVQADLVNAAMRYRSRERAVAEEFLSTLQLPTRRELDDAYRALNNLRRQVRTLNREVQQLSDEVARTREQPASGTEAPPATRARAKPKPKPASRKTTPRKASTPRQKKSTAAPKG